MEKVVNAKYRTKNNRIYSGEVFFAATNHTNAINSSARNFIPTATKVCIACTSASSDNPLIKIINEMKAENANETIRDIMAGSFMPMVKTELTSSAPQEMIIKSIRSGSRYFRYRFLT